MKRLDGGELCDFCGEIAREVVHSGRRFCGWSGICICRACIAEVQRVIAERCGTIGSAPSKCGERA